MVHTATQFLRQCVIAGGAGVRPTVFFLRNGFWVCVAWSCAQWSYPKQVVAARIASGEMHVIYTNESMSSCKKQKKNCNGFTSSNACERSKHFDTDHLRIFLCKETVVVAPSFLLILSFPTFVSPYSQGTDKTDWARKEEEER